MPLQRILSLIDRIYPDLDAIHGDYCIIGSSALLFSGFELAVHDLDILTSGAGAKKLRNRWGSFLINNYKPENSGRFRSVFGRFNFPELPVEVMGDLEVNRLGNWMKVIVDNPNSIEIAGRSINIPTLPDQKRIFEILGREKDLEKVKLLDAGR